LTGIQGAGMSGFGGNAEEISKGAIDKKWLKTAIHASDFRQTFLYSPGSG